MEDVAPKLLEKIQNDFEDNYNKSELIASLYQKVRDGTATYLEANDYAIEVGKLLSNAYRKNLSSAVLPDGHMYYNIANRIITSTMEHNHELIVTVANMVQSDLNELNGFGIKAIMPEVNSNRIKGIIEKVVATERFDDVKWVLGESVINFSQNVVAETIETNAEFHYDMGIEGKIIRETSGGCCEWCNRLAGTYVYPDVPQDVYRRHDYCRCTVDYELKGARSNVHNNRTGKRQYVKDKYGNYVKSKDARIQRAKEMAATEKTRKETARKKRIATWDKKREEKGLTQGSVTRKGTNAVDVTYIHSEAYKQKFANISNNTELNDALYKNAVSILMENKSTDTETLCILSAKSGKTILRKRGEENVIGVKLTDKDLRIIKNYGNVIGIHNHPTNLMPNGSDLTAAGYRKYDFGVIVTHDGRLFKYSAGDKPFVTQALDARIDKYMSKDYNLPIEEAYMKALNEFRKEYNISWQEVE